MKIGIYKDTFANNRGADIAVKNLATGLSERGHVVTLFDKSEFAAKVRGDYDVIISTGTNEILDLAEVEGLPPIVQQFHTDPKYPFRHWIKRWRRNRAIKAALKKAAAFQVLRKAHVETLQKLIGVSGDRITAIGNWSSFEGRAITTISEEKVILCPGAINADKNQSLIVDAFSYIAAEFPDWQVHIYGKGKAKEEAALKKKIDSYALSDRILLKGYADLEEPYRRCAFVAFPSKTEGFGMVIVDAAVFSKPTLMIQDWIGCGEVADSRDFACALRRLMSDGDSRRDLGEKSRIYCSANYSREKILDAWEILLKNTQTFNPLVSVVVPAYNVEGTVSATIESLFAQDYSNFEVLCIDDGSTDGTSAILDAFAAKDGRVRVVHQANGGYGSAINAGLAAAKGEWIAILESDDVCRANMLSTMVATGERESADMVKADWNLWWNKTGDLRPAGKINRRWCGHFLTQKERIALCCIPPAIWSAIYRRSFLEKHDIRCLETPGAAFQDTSFNIKAILSAERLVVAQDAFVDYRQDNPSSSVCSKGQAFSLLHEYSELASFLENRSDIDGWAHNCIRELEYRAYLWNLKRLASEQRVDFLEKARKRLGGYKLLATPEKLLRKIESKVGRRERRRRRIVSLHCNSNRIELIVWGRTWLYIRL